MGVRLLVADELIALWRNLLIKLLALYMINELWHPALDKASLQEGRSTAEQLLILELPAFFRSQLDVGFGDCGCCVATYHV